MHTSSRRMLRLCLFVLLPSLISTEENHSRWFLCKKDTTAACLYCSPARQKPSVITCLWLLFAQICPHLRMRSSFGKHCTFSTLTGQQLLFGGLRVTCTAGSSWRWAHSVKWNMCFKYCWIIYCPWSSLSFINPRQSYKDMTTSFFPLPNISWCDNIKLRVWVGLFSVTLSSHEILSKRHIVDETWRLTFEVLTWIGPASGLSVCCHSHLTSPRR